MEGRSIGFGIIGCGMVSAWHAQAIQRVPGARLVGVTDTNPSGREAMARRFGVAAFTGVDEMLAHSDVSAVCVCVPSGLHAEMAIKAASAGRHVVVEKPMAITLPQADALIDASDRNGVKVTVISQMRFAPAVSLLKQAVDSGSLGRLVTGDVLMKYYRSPEYYGGSPWKGTWRLDGGGALMNQGIHGIDLLRFIMGPARTVFAHARTLARRIEVEDTAAAVVEWENGALGLIQGTTSVYPGSPRRLEVSGDKGTIVLEEESIVSWEVEGGERPANLTCGRAAVSSTSDPAAMDVEGHVMQITDMVEAIRDERPPRVDCREGRKALELILAVYESSRTGLPVRLGA